MADNTTEVQKLYVEYFLRPADYAGLQYWLGGLNNHTTTVAEIAAAFSHTQEYHDAYAGQTNRQIVNTVYQNLFGRDAEPAGVDYWATQLDNQVVTIDNVVTEVGRAAQGSDKVIFNGRVSVATAFTTHLDLASEQAAYQGPQANVVAKSFIGSIVSLESGAYAINPAVIDEQIATIVGMHNSGHDVLHSV